MLSATSLRIKTAPFCSLQAFQAGDGFREAPAVPAAIDEVADMTFPVDPNLKARAEEAAKNISHDLPLTVNDEVLSFLNFFQTPRGAAGGRHGARGRDPGGLRDDHSLCGSKPECEDSRLRQHPL